MRVQLAHISRQKLFPLTKLVSFQLVWMIASLAMNFFADFMPAPFEWQVIMFCVTVFCQWYFIIVVCGEVADCLNIKVFKTKPVSDLD